MLSSGPARTARRLVAKPTHKARPQQRCAAYKRTFATVGSVSTERSGLESISGKLHENDNKRKSNTKSTTSNSSFSDDMLHLHTFDQRLTSGIMDSGRSFRLLPEFAGEPKPKKQNFFRSRSLARSDSDPVFSTFIAAIRSNDAAKVESSLIKLAQYGDVSKLSVEHWEAALFLISGRIDSLSRMKQFINLYQSTGRMLTSQVVQSVVVQMRRLALADQPHDLEYVEHLFDELKASKATLTLALLMSIMQFYIDVGLPERALNFGNRVILLRENFSWNENAFHLFIRAYLSVEPPAIDTALNYLRQMNTQHIKPLSHSIIAIARCFLESGSPKDAILLIETYLPLFKRGSRDQMYMLAFYMRCLAVSMDERIHDAYRIYTEYFPEMAGHPSFASSAMIIYHSRRGDLETVFSSLRQMEDHNISPQPSVCVELIKACAAKGAAGRQTFLNRINEWNKRGKPWLTLANESVYPDLLSFFDIPPGEGPPLTPTLMAKKMENFGFSFKLSQAWVALLHYFAIVRRSDAIHEILNAAHTKGLRFRGNQLNPVFEFLLNKGDVDACVRLLDSLRATADCRNICLARIVNYYVANSDHEAARALIKKKINTYGPLSISFYHHALLLASSVNNATPQEIFDTYLPLLEISDTNYPLHELLKHNFNRYFNEHQYQRAQELLGLAVEEVLKSSLVPTELFRLFVGISLRHLPEPDMVKEVEDFLRRLDNAPSKMGPAIAKPLLSVNIRRIVSLVEQGHAVKLTVPLGEPVDSQ